MHAIRIAQLMLAPCLLWACGAQAGIVFELGTARTQADTLIELRGVLFNDTGNVLSAPVAQTLEGQWTDADGRQMPALFTLRTSPEAANLPANTYTRMIWTGMIPANVKGTLTLRLAAQQSALMAVEVGPQTAITETASARALMPDGSATRAHTQAAGPLTTGGSASTGAVHQAQEGVSAPVETQASAGTQGQIGSREPAEAPALSPFETFRNALSPYEPTYFVAGGSGGTTARYQISIKYRLFSPTDAAHPGWMDDWYLGYTQTALWDLHAPSIPFIDTTYNPSLFWMRESLWKSADQHWSLGVNTGLEHRSNGKDGEDSRSLNDLYIQPEINYRLGTGSTVSLRPRFKYYVATDRGMHYPDSLGHVDWKLRWAQDDGAVLSALYRQGKGARHATQLSAAWPLKRTPLGMNGYFYVQYFQGWGETLLGYDQKSGPQVRAGIALVP